MGHTRDQVIQTLATHGYSRRFILPFWYRVYRRLGVRLPLPVLMNFPEHLLYGFVFAATVFTTCSGIALWGGWISEFRASGALLVATTVPALNWLRYLKARRLVTVDSSGVSP